MRTTTLNGISCRVNGCGWLLEKKSVSSRPLNIAAEKERLRREMEVVESKQNKAEVERIQARLKELEAISEQKKGLDTKAVRLAEMNKKKRAENFKMASEKKAINTGLKEGEEGYDPFSRRWTRSRNYYVSNTTGGDEVAASANGDVAAKSGLGVGSGSVVAGVTGVAGLSTTAATLEAVPNAGKLVDTNAPVDQGTVSNSLHSFQLEISLDNFEAVAGIPQGIYGKKAKDRGHHWTQSPRE